LFTQWTILPAIGSFNRVGIFAKLPFLVDAKSSHLKQKRTLNVKLEKSSLFFYVNVKALSFLPPNFIKDHHLLLTETAMII
jgi:hypothetical protein